MEYSVPNIPIASPGKLAEAAAREDWGAVDPAIGDLADRGEFLYWAKRNTDNEDGNLRDLAVSLYEATSRHPNDEMMQRFTDLMIADENPYVQFRSAFTLFRHGDRSKAVIDKVRSALDDEEVAEVAQKYLNQLNQEENKN